MQLAGALIQGHKYGLRLVLVVNEDDKVLVEERAGSGAVRGVEAQGIIMPQERPLEVVTHQAAGAEKCNHPFAIGHRRRGGIAVLIANSRFRRFRRRLPAPEQPAISPTETIDRPLLTVGRRAGEKDAVAPDDRRRVTM